MPPFAMFTGLAARYWSKQEADRAAQVKKTALPSVPSKGPQPSSSAASAAKQLGFAASASIEPKASHPSGFQPALDRSTKRTHDEAFISSSRQDVHKTFRLSDRQPKKPEYPRRGAPPDAITKDNEPPPEVMSISSDNEDDSDDEPLLATQTRKRRATSGTSTPERQLKDKVDQQSTEIRGLKKQLSDSQAMCERVRRDQSAKDEQILALSQRLDVETGRIQSLVSQKDALNDNIANIRNRASREKEDANRAAIQLRDKVDGLQKRLFDETMRCSNLDRQLIDLQRKEKSDKATTAETTELEVSNQQLRERNREVEKLNSDLVGKYNRLKVRYDNLDAEYGNREAEYEKLEAQHGELKTEHDELQSERNHREAKITRLEEDKDHQNLRLETLQEQLEEQKARADRARADGSATRKIEELERQLVGLREELIRNEKSREDRETQWQSMWYGRVAMEENWRTDLQAIMNDMRAGPAAPGPTQQASQREAPRNVASQQSAPQRDAAQRDASRGSSSRSGGPSR